VEEFKVGQERNFHLYLLIGQSNMAGRGQVEPQDREIHPRVFMLDKAGNWVPAADPLHFDKPIAGVGPGLTFGRIMADREPSIRVGLIPCAAGGSPISVWKHGGFWEQTNSKPYDDAIERTRIAMKDGVLMGILWHQGESDSNENDAELYGDRLMDLIDTLRRELDAPEAPFVAAALGDFVGEGNPHARVVNEVIRRLPQRVKNTACVDSSGLEHKGDNVHFSAESARELGRRYAEAMIRLLAQ
jgi:hypothetical protein